MKIFVEGVVSKALLRQPLLNSKDLIFDNNKMNFKGTIIIKREEEWFVATCIENSIASQGKTVDDAIGNLKEAIALYYEDEPEEKAMLPQEQVYMTSLEMAL